MFAKIFKIALRLLPQHDNGQPAAHHDQKQGKTQQAISLLRAAESATPEQEGKACQHRQQHIKEPAGKASQSRQRKTQRYSKGRAGLLPAVAQASKRKQGEGRCQSFGPHKGGERRKNGSAKQQHAASQCGLAVEPCNAAQNPYGHKTQQTASHGGKGKEQMGKLRGNLGKQGVNAAQKPEKYRPLGKAIPRRGKPHAALSGLHKGYDARCLAWAVDAVPHKSRPSLSQHDEQQGQGPNKAGRIKNIVAKAGACGRCCRLGRGGCGLGRRSGFASLANIAKHTSEPLGRNGYWA